MSDDITAYMNAAKRIPLMSPDDEIRQGRHVQELMALLDQWGLAHITGEIFSDRFNPTPQERKIIRLGIRARDDFMRRNMRLVTKVVQKFWHVRGDLTKNDLIDEGCIGMARAIERYDPQRGYKFSTYAYWWIRQACVRCIASQSRTIRLPVKVNDVERKLHVFLHAFEDMHGRKPDLQEQADAMGCTVSSLEVYLKAPKRCLTIERQGSPDDNAGCIAEVIPCERSTPNDIVDDYDMRQVIRWSMECLDEREFFICQLYYGFDGSDGLSLLEISEKMGISRQHCSVIHIEAKAKLAKAAYHYGYQPTRLQ